MASDDYEVGYCKPPMANQFKPGQSGNPKGRPKGAKNLKTIVEEELLSPITVKEGGKAKSVTKLSAVVKTTMNSALKGNAKASDQILNLAKDHLPEALEDLEGDKVSPEELAVLQSHGDLLAILEPEHDEDPKQD